MNPLDTVRDSINGDALGLSGDDWAALLTRVMDAAALAAPGKLDAQAQHALAYLFGLEARFISRQISSGSGAEGSFAYSELGTRLARAQADQKAAQAEYDRLTGTGTGTGKRRGSGSIPATFEV